ncbi:glyoxylase I family protein [Breznakia sp. PF5-3]|uniref:VOC family protein n=1 Tax=unclassified Breznakia TaxID=2623764 RepID=UPI0024055C95|nr:MULTISPECIES: VOC family protein [unclassified Breznakia]MDF9825655.1 glyoxylase I family protein [Breznakia sp. PM6-1]MDF9836505.1 glyoxylase I family protein [Breznakia sp. PF5-3]MDF9838650.1 glyoxylase I family protein [Breznakia sp. PFB2-8]MDF9860681.1 glyoxylase I family protein [Breznakia sp. PH5-24]
MIRYIHTNIVAKDVEKLTTFYKTVLDCKSIKETRDLKGEWLDDLTGIEKAHIVGEHLLLPGYGSNYPTLEIFSYDELEDNDISNINKQGFAHLAFQVDDVESMVSKVIKAGGSMVGEIVKTMYPNNKEATFVYVRDPEGNIVELQSIR